MIKRFLVLLLILGIKAGAQTPVEKPSLIPLPQKLEWKKGLFALKTYKEIVVKSASLYQEAELLQKQLKELGFLVPIKKETNSNQPKIVLELGRVEAQDTTAEAYKLRIDASAITITGSGNAGVFYGLETLKQLTNSGKNVPACSITDWPSFSWRGYMIDAGRNYQPMHLLKQQIDVIAAYKLNIFHFHFTEDIAWRLESKLYPQLTDPETMIRNKGSFYTQNDLKELINYCKERHITLIPEIDMPGHSAAFKRAMKTDMQSDSGLAIVKNILNEFCDTFDVPYIHIGADEVKITNNNFLPEVIALLEKRGKKVIGWEPGGKFTESTIRQLWMEDATKVSANHNVKYIDSRHLYINHMDPLESVVSIFKGKIANLDKGNDAALGGTLCVWPDRRVSKPEDVFMQTAVYPAVLAFAERSWRGGGQQGWLTYVGLAGSEEVNVFKEFEHRLMNHKQHYFSKMPFPYQAQSHLKWKFYGPFNNQGDLSKQFHPQETKEIDTNKATLTAIGGTFILRHWWGPVVTGLIEKPEENTTWYASTKIWSNKDQLQNFWIGFNNISRSYGSDSPYEETWDNRKSEVFVNSKLITPPNWKQAGAKGSLELPLIDEGYEYREPTKVWLKKGWNTILVKLPVGSFKGKDWQNPEKWMFTVVPWL
ncbi:beta-N-acetylhexosaminidase [Pedobacter sp. B4-66]|uniref:beta-N-acetylhexosaminidase n=1 Tax=Pedobacter sp. B4-66 TaxID=2817280 RepID=UPI001BDA0A96|nr:beta-N-acetylhexosaminidase [Pedobacter sp. B4-66]